MAIWFLPPLLISSVAQVVYFRKTKLWSKFKALCIGVILTTVVLSPAIGILSFSLPIPRWLSVTQDLFILPLAFVIVFCVAFLLSLGAFIYGRSKHA